MFKGLFKRAARRIESTDDQYLPSLILTESLADNIFGFQEIFKDDGTFNIRRFQNAFDKDIKCCILYMEGMSDTETISESIIRPVQEKKISSHINGKNLLSVLSEKVIEANGILLSDDSDRLLESMLYGDVILLAEGFAGALIIDCKGWKSRAISEPVSEKVVRGPREGFNESIMTNLTLIRRKIQNTNLKFQFKKLGEQTKTRVCICFIEGLANEKILDELHSRLGKVKIDAILDSGYIQELIKDAPYSPFDTIGTTERPDVVAAKLLEGRIAVLVDGSPFALTLPYMFVEYFQVNEDYYNNFVFSSFNRFIRIIGATLTITIPALYIAVVNFHQELLPTPLLLSIAAARQGVPFPTVIEAMVMIFVFEILREAGTRIPTPIGQTISIVGALVLGEAAADARIVSAPIIIITAITGITSLLSVRLLGAPIIIRFFFIISASVLGLFGMIFVFLGLVIHLMSLRSFGLPFTLNISSLQGQEIKDTAIRVPWWYMRLRPPLLSDKNRKRESNNMGSRKL